MSTLLKVSGLVKRFPGPRPRSFVWAVNDVSFSLQRGATLALVGESGSGKTTVGRCILRLIEPDLGTIEFDGHDITRIRERELRHLRKQIQIVFQEPHDAMDPRSTVGEIIREPLRILEGMTTQQQLARVLELAEQTAVDFSDLARYPHELSAGMLQRVGVARAMATSPDLIVLDEPTSLLDPSARADIIDLLMTLQKNTGISYLFISHDLSMVRHVSQTVAVMYLGRIVETGTSKQIFGNPKHPYTRALMSAILEPDPFSKRAQVPLKGEIPSPIDLPSGCFLHSRCPISIASCSQLTPLLREAEEGHAVSCIRVAPTREQLVEEGQIIGNW